MDNILITGATSLLGRNFLFELYELLLIHKDFNIGLLGRGNKTKTLQDRILSILLHECPSRFIGDKEKIVLLFSNKERVEYFDLNLDFEVIVTDEIKTKIIESDYKQILHIASLTDFRSTNEIQRKLFKTNVEGTNKLLDFSHICGIQKFIYISSAYVCGLQSGVIAPNYTDIETNFRNPYEKTKLLAEMNVKEYCQAHDIKFLILRPSTISGRLIEKPFGVIYKFDVFYAWMAYFYYLKSQDNLAIDCSWATSIRIQYNMNSGLNIVPVDYATKLMRRIIFTNSLSENYYYLVNNEETSHHYYLNAMLEALNIQGVKHSNNTLNPNRLEKLYMRSVGKIFTPYINGEAMIFDITNLSNEDIICPKITKETFKHLLDYAINEEFNPEE